MGKSSRWSWGKMFGRLRKQRAQKQRKARQPRDLRIEPLERRELLAVLYWDPDQNAANNNISTAAGLGGAGTWASAGAACWYNPSTGTDVVWNNANNDSAVFWGTAGTVTGSGSVTASSLSFRTTAYTMTGGTLALPTGGTTVTVSTGTATISSTITGSNAIAKDGAGTLTLSGTNSYTGGTTINGGNLVFSSTSALPTTGTVLINAGGALNVTGAYTTVATWLSSGRISTSSTGALALTAANSAAISMGSYTGLSLGATGSYTYGGTLTPNGTTYRLGGGGGTLTVSSVLSGARSLVASGNLTLTGTNTYSGGTTINGGNMVFSSSSALPTTGTILINAGGVLNVTGAYTTVATWLSSGRISTSSTGTLALTAANSETIGMGSYTGLSLGATGSYTYSGTLTPAGTTYRLGGGGGTLTVSSVLSGARDLVVQGNVDLTGTNTYTGGTTINAGTVTFAGDGLGASGNITFAGNSTLRWASGNTLDISSRLEIDDGVNAALNTGAGTVTFATGFGGSSSGSITKAGSGTLVLLGTNTYTGGTTLNAGWVAFGSGGLGASGAITVAGNACLRWAGSNTEDISSRLVLAFGTVYLDTNGNTVTLATGFGGVGAGSALLKYGTGTLILAGANSYTGATTISAGILQLGNGTSSNGSVAGNIVDNASLVFANPNAQTYSGVISGTGTVTKIGAGALTLTGTNTYSGGTVINGGNLVFSSTSALPTTGAILISAGGALNATGAYTAATWLSSGKISTASTGALALVADSAEAISMGSYTGLSLGAAGNYTYSGTLTPADTTYHLGGGGGTLTISSVLSGARDLVASGNLTLTGENTYTGGTTIQDGAVLSFASGGLGTSGSVTFAGDSTLQWAGGNTQDISSRLVLNSGVNATLDTSSNLITFATAIGGSSSGSLTKAGTGTLVLLGVNSYTGNTTINAGILQLGNGTSSNGSVAGNIVDNASLVFANPNAQTYSGVISGAGTVTKIGAGALTLTGTNTYSGGTVINGGNLVFSSTSALPTTGAILISAQAALNVTGAYTTVAAWLSSGRISTASTGALALVANNSEAISMGSYAGLSLGAAGSYTYSGMLTSTGTTYHLGGGGGTLTVSSALSGARDLIIQGNVALTGTNTYSGVTTISAGTLQLGNGTSSNGSVAGNIVDNASLVFANPNAQTYSGAISGSGTMTKSGTGVLTLTGTNTYTGGTTIQDGAVLSFASGGLGTSGTITFVGTSTLQWASGNAQDVSSRLVIGNGVNARLDTGSNTVTLATGFGGSSSGSLTKTGSGTLVLTGANTYTGITTISAGTLQLGNGSTSNGSVVGGIANNSNLVFANPNDQTLSGGGIYGTGSVTKIGTGTLIIAGAATWTGGTTISEGTLQGASGGGNIVDNGNLVVSGSLTMTYSGVISGTGTVTKSGAGTLILTGANTYTGVTTVSEGTLQLGDGNGSNGSVAGDIVDNASVVFAIPNAQTYSGVISGSGTVTKGSYGYGTLILTGANTYTGVTTINAGTLQLGDGVSRNGSVASNIVIATNAKLIFANPNTQTYGGVISGAISGSGSLTKSGAGTLILTGANTYTGVTTISAGTLQLGDGASSNGSVAGYIVDNANLVFANPNDQTYSGRISGIGTVTKIGAGTLTLTNADTFEVSAGFAGVTTISEGTLQLSCGNWSYSVTGNIVNNANLAFVSSGWVNCSGVISGTGTVTKTGASGLYFWGANTYTGVTTISEGTLTVGDGQGHGSVVGDIVNNGTLDFSNQNAQTYSGVISGSGTVGKWSAGTLTLTGANTYTGGTTIGAGTLVMGSTSALGVTNGRLTFYDPGTLDLNGYNLTVRDLSGSGTIIDMASGTATDTLTVNVTTSSSFYGRICDGTTRHIALVKAGNGVLFLSNLGQNTYTYTGGTTVSEGTLQLVRGSTWGWMVGNIVNNASLVIDGFININGVISGSGTVTVYSGSLVLTSASAYTGGTTVNSGAYLTLGDGYSNGSVVGNIVDNGRVLFLNSNAQTYSGMISGTGTVTKSWAGTLTLTGTNTYSGGTTINGGNMVFSSSSALPTTGTILINAGGVLNVTGAYTTVATWLGSWRISTSSTGTLALTAANSETIGMGSYTGLSLGATGSYTYSGTLTPAGTTYRLGGGGGTLTVSSVLSGARSLVVHGNVVLTGTNTYSGVTTISAGTLQLGNGTSSNGSVAGDIVDSAALVFANPNAQTYSGTISGAGTVTKSGAGTLTLAGANTYTGATTVSQGELQVTGSLGASAVTVTSGTLSGTGSIAGNVTAQGGTLSPGIAGAGTLTVGDLSLSSSATDNTIVIQSGCGQLDVTGSVNLDSATLSLSTQGLTGQPPHVLVLIQNDGTDAVSGTFAGLAEGAPVTVGDTTYYVTYCYNAEAGQIGTGNDVALLYINQAPGFTKGTDQSVLEDAGTVTVTGWATNISAGPANESGQALSFVVSSDHPELFAANGAPAIDAATGTLTYTLAADRFGTATVTVVLHDDGGTENGGIDTSDPQTFTITVGEVNDAPGFTKGADQSVLEDAGTVTVTGWATNISAGPANESGQALSFVVSSDHPEFFAANGAPAIDAATGTLTYTLAADRFGTATVTVVLHDDGGTENGGVDTSDPQTFTISVGAVNDAPSALVVTPSASVIEEGESISLGGTFVDPDPLDTHTVTIDWGDGSEATAVDLAAGVVSFSGVVHTYRDNPSEGDSYTIHVTVTDADSASVSADVEVTVSNVAPTATLSNNGPVEPGASVTVSFVDPTDASSEDLLAGLRYSLATSQSALATSYATAGETGSQTFTFAETGTYTVYGRVFDKDGGSRDLTTEVHVLVASTTTLVASTNPSLVGHDVTLMATVPGDATGTVSFLDGTTVLDTVTVSNTGSTAQAVHFDGNSAVNIGSLGAMPNEGAIAFWVSADVVQSLNNLLSTSGINGGNRGIRFEEATQGSFGVAVGDDSGNFTGHGFTTTGWTAQTWHHIVVTWDKSQNRVQGYWNGQLVFDDAQTLWATTFNNLQLGGGYYSRYWQGSLDELLFLDKKLDQSDVAALYNGGSGRYGVPESLSGHLMAGYHFDEGNGAASVTDFSGNGHTGTVSGNVSWVAGQVTGQTVTYTTSSLAIGSHTLTAVYSGDTKYAPSTSTGIVQQVDPLPEASVVLSSSTGSAALGQSVILTATLPADATGVVSLLDGSTVIGTQTLSAGDSGSGEAIHLNGGSTVDIGNLGTTPMQGAIAFWINADVVQSFNNVLSTSGGNAGNEGIRFEEHTGGEFAVVMGSASYTYGAGYLTTDSFTANTWHYIVFSWDAYQGQITGYFDGALAFNNNLVFWPVALGNVQVGVGWYGRYWQGAVDELLFLDSAVTGDQASTLYNAGKGLYGVPESMAGHLIAGYHFDEDAGATSVSDFSGHDHNGTIVGNVTWVPGQVTAQATRTVTFTTSALTLGDHTLSIYYGGNADYSPSTSNVLAENVADGPTILSLGASSSLVTGKSTTLSATAEGIGDNSPLTYTWRITALPVGAAEPSFSDNGTETANSTIVTFSHAGTYQIMLTVGDANGRATTQGLSIEVAQTLTTISVGPTNLALSPGGSALLHVVTKDQFGADLATTPTLIWSTTKGTIDAHGRLTAPVEEGSLLVTATDGTVTGGVEVHVSPSSVPAPEELAVTAIGVDSVSLSWQNDATSVLAYAIEQLSGSSWQQIAWFWGSATTATVTGQSFQGASAYTFRLQAWTNTSSGYQYVPSSAVSVTTASWPTAPTGLSVKAVSDVRIDLAWEDNATNETTYTLQRSTDGATWTTIATLAAGTTCYSDLAVAEATSYTYRLQAGNAQGTSAWISGSATTLATAPGDLTVTSISNSEVHLNWQNHSAKASYYVIEQLVGNGWQQIASLGGSSVTTATITGRSFQPGTTYTFRVRAYSYTGSQYSFSSNVVSATTSAWPWAATNLVTSPVSDTQIQLAWQDNAGDDASYILQRSTDNSTWTTVATLAAHSTGYADSGLTEATTYYYRVQATNSQGGSAFSTTNASTLPSASDGLAVSSITAGQAFLIWQNHSARSNAWSVEQLVGSNWQQVAWLSGAPSSVTLTGQAYQPGTEYTFRVRAYSDTGSQYSFSSNVASVVTAVWPMAPTGLATTCLSSSQVRLTWEDNAGDDASYVLERSTDNNTWTTVATLAAHSTSHTDSGLSEATTYYYRVRAVNTSGDSAYSAASRTTLPAAPDNLTITAYGDGQVSLSWQNHSSQANYFVVERLLGNSWQQISWLWNDNTNSATLGSSDYQSGNQQFFRVRVYSFSGGQFSLPSNVVSTLAAAPAAPTGLVTTAVSETSIRLTWEDNAGDDASYTLERSIDNATWTSIATLAAHSTGYADSGLTEATTYYYRLQASNTQGASAYATTSGATLAAAPSDLTIVAISREQVSLSWQDHSSRATYYAVERFVGNGWQEVARLWDGSATTTTITGQDFQPNSQYTFRVRAFSYTGNQYSLPSNVLLVTTSDWPAAPSGLAAKVVSDTTVNLTWQDNAGDDASYTLQRSTDNTTWTTIATLAAHSTCYADSGLTEATNYYYRVQAANANGSSAYSTASAATLPTAPSDLAITAISPTTVALSWQDHSARATAYVVEQFSGGDWQQIATLGGNSVTTATITGQSLLPGSQYAFRVRASSNIVYQNSLPSNVVSATVAAPPAPSGLVATVSASQVDLRWEGNAGDLANYLVERSLDNATWTTLATLSPQSTTYTDSGVVERTTYYYRVQAANDQGISTSSTAAVTTMPLAPDNLVVNSIDAGHVTLTWQNRSTQADRYTVEQLIGGSWQEIAGVWDRYATTATIAGNFQPATTYSFRVRASVVLGSWLYSPPSNVVVLTTATWPAAPTNLAATATSSSSIRLTWRDNATSATGYTVLRSTDGANWTTVATLAATATSYTDSELTECTSYSYHVQAVNDQGTSAASSASVATLPAAPSDLAVTSIDAGQVTLSWQDNSAAEHYYIIEQFVAGNWQQIATASANSTTVTITGRSYQAVVPYDFRVRAYNYSCGTSLPSNTATGVNYTPTAFWTGAGLDSLWSDAANWSTGYVPGVNDDVLIDVAGNAVIVLGPGAQTVRSLVSADTLQLSGDLTVTQAAILSGSTTVDGGTLTLGGQTTVSGTLALESGTINLGGNVAWTPTAVFAGTAGTVNITGTLLATGSIVDLGNAAWNLVGGTIQGGTLTGSGTTLVCTGGTLSGVTLDVATTDASALTILNGLTLNATLTVADNARLYFSGNESLLGIGQLVIGTTRWAYVELQGGTLTIGPQMTVRGAGFIEGGSLINQGLLEADRPHESLTIMNGLTNQGTLAAVGSASLAMLQEALQGRSGALSGTELVLGTYWLDNGSNPTFMARWSSDGVHYSSDGVTLLSNVGAIFSELERNTSYQLEIIATFSNGSRRVYQSGSLSTLDLPDTSGWYQVTADVPESLGTLDYNQAPIFAGSMAGAVVRAFGNFVHDGTVPEQDSFGAFSVYEVTVENHATGAQYPTYTFWDPPVPPNASNPNSDPPKGFVAAARPVIGTSKPSGFGGDPIRYSDGATDYSVTDVSSNIDGDTFSLGRSWTSNTVWSYDNGLGNGWVDDSLPTLQWAGKDTMAIVYSATNIESFDFVNGQFVPTSYTADNLVYDATNHRFILSDSSGNQYTFGDRSVIEGILVPGAFLSKTDASGVVTTVTARTALGNIQTLCRYAANGTLVEQWNYSYICSSDAELLQSVTLQQVQNGVLSTIQTVTYSYYGGTHSGDDQYGNLGDLKTAITTDASGAVTSAYYYRYVTPSDITSPVVFGSGGGSSSGAGGSGGGSVPPPPPAKGLKYVFDTEAYAALLASLGETSLQSTAAFSAPDSVVAPYAQHYFEYDGERRVTLHYVAGAGTWTYSFSNNGNYSDDVNTWYSKTVETTPDGSVNIAYANGHGDVMLKVTYDDASQANEAAIVYYRYNGLGQVVLEASGSAITGYSESYADLLGNGLYLADHTGSIYSYQYGTDTTATDTTAGDVKGESQDYHRAGGRTRRGRVGRDKDVLRRHRKHPGSRRYRRRHRVFRRHDCDGRDHQLRLYLVYGHRRHADDDRDRAYGPRRRPAHQPGHHLPVQHLWPGGPQGRRQGHGNHLHLRPVGQPYGHDRELCRRPGQLHDAHRGRHYQPRLRRPGPRDPDDRRRGQCHLLRLQQRRLRTPRLHRLASGYRRPLLRRLRPGGLRHPRGPPGLLYRNLELHLERRRCGGPAHQCRWQSHGHGVAFGRPCRAEVLDLQTPEFRGPGRCRAGILQRDGVDLLHLPHAGRQERQLL